MTRQHPESLVAVIGLGYVGLPLLIVDTCNATGPVTQGRDKIVRLGAPLTEA